MNILLHICCGPCSLYVIDALKKRYPEENITGYFYNPNIHPYDELIRREAGAAKACAHKEIPLISKEDYDLASWKCFGGEGAKRCVMCYQRRFEETARYAAEHGYSHFTSTLFVSPYQNHEAMNRAARAAATRYGVTFLEGSDFREGFREGQNQARALGLYRQKYCGCIRSFKGE